MTGLREPLPTTLCTIATALSAGVAKGTYSKGGGSYDWRTVVAQERDAALAFLRSDFERKATGRSIREGHISLLPRAPRLAPIFLVVLCAAGRAEGRVSRLGDGEVLYLITAPEGLSEGLMVGRLSPQ